MDDHDQLIKAVGRIVREQEQKFQNELDEIRVEAKALVKNIPQPAVIEEIRVEKTSERDRKIFAKFSNGVERAVGGWVDPTPIHVGTWEPQTAYQEGDEVAKDGAMWRSVSSNNTDEPATSGRWRLASQRGKTGRPGIQGDRGEKGDAGLAGKDADPLTTARIVLQKMPNDENLQRKIEDLVQKGIVGITEASDDRLALYSRGEYQRGDDYARGDLVSIQNLGLFVAEEATSTDPRSNSPAWRTVAVTTPGGGGGVSTVSNFLALTDTPSVYVGAAGLFARVNPAETGLVFDTVTPAVPVSLAQPLLPSTGDLWYASSLSQLMVWDGTFWVAA